MATTATRIYKVTHTDGRAPRLVRAYHPSTALSHVSKGDFAVEVATQDDLEKLLPTTKVEQVKSEQLPLAGDPPTLTNKA